MKTVSRAGRYYRVCDPSWHDCCDGSYAARFGGRWNPPQSFPTLYLSADIATARANAVKRFEGEAFGLFDLNPTARPHLQLLVVRECDAVDAVTPEGLASLRLPSDYPHVCGWKRCQSIGMRAHRAGHAAVAARSAARLDGEELALFDFSRFERLQRLAFDTWFFGDEPA